MSESSLVPFVAPEATREAEEALQDLVASCYHDPLRFVRAMYPWGESGPLANHDGPDLWQTEFLRKLGEEVRRRGFNGHTPVMPVRMAVSKGHDVGGSTLLAWLADWIMSTRPHSQGTVTANTAIQLETKTWASIRRWTRWCLTGHWFVINAARFYHPDFPESWFCTPQTCKEENSEAFAGQHAADSTSWYGFDEDSAVPEVIHEVAEGGLTDGEPMVFRFGNPTRNTGSFHEAVFGKQRDRWISVIVDSRSSRIANKELIQEWEQDYGEDSDFFRVRVRGLPPSASDAQFIDSTRLYAAQRRSAAIPFADEPLIAGVDVSGGGSAWTVCRFRRGLDGRSTHPIRITGERSRDRNHVIAILAERLSVTDPEHQIAAMFIDTAYGAPIVERLRLLGYHNVHEVNFGGESPNKYQANQRAYQWNKMKDWLLTGAIDPKDTRLEADLCGPGFHLDKKDRLVLESKESMQKRGVASPDDGDALSLTFAMPVRPEGLRTGQPRTGWLPTPRSWQG